jgi:AcrR family transcriptional regulator
MGNTKDIIIDKALELFLSKSYDSVSISDISSLIGMTKGALYHHFASKAEIFQAVVDKYLVFPDIEVDVNCTSLSDLNSILIDNLRTMLNRMFPTGSSYVSMHYFALIADAFRYYPGFKDNMHTYMQNQTDKVEIIIANAVKNKEIRDNIDKNVLTRLYFSSAIGLAGNLLHDYTVEESIAILKSQVDLIYQLLKV